MGNPFLLETLPGLAPVPKQGTKAWKLLHNATWGNPQEEFGCVVGRSKPRELLQKAELQNSHSPWPAEAILAKQAGYEGNPSPGKPTPWEPKEKTISANPPR